MGNISDFIDSQQNKCALLGARLAEFERCLHGVTSLLEVKEMNAIYQELNNRLFITKGNHRCQNKSFGKCLNLICFMINIIDGGR